MPTPLNAVERIKAIREKADQDVAKLETEALQTLSEELRAAQAEVSRIQGEIRTITGKPVKASKGSKSGGSKSAGKKPDLQELKSILAKADGKTINLRNEGLDTENVKTLAAANPGLLKMGGKGAWPTVTLLK